MELAEPQGTSGQRLDIRPLWDGFGVEVLGVDLAAADPATQDALVDAFHRAGAMVIRNQTLSAEDQLAFTRRFGELETNTSDEFTYPGHNEIYIISNKEEDGRPIGNWQAGQGWHTDASFQEKPTLCTLLYAVEVPAEGSDTLFADLCAAYDALSDAEKDAYGDLKIKHSLTALRRMQGRPLSEADLALPDVIHPMIRTHPADGRKALWVSTGTVTGVVGMSNPEGLDLIHRLVDFATEERFVHAHKWRVGDLLIWDNRCTLHRGTPFDLTRYQRLVYRTWVKGDRPV
jgi:taurine dioxygenase